MNRDVGRCMVRFTNLIWKIEISRGRKFRARINFVILFAVAVTMEI